MRVTQITERKDRNFTTFSADIIFAKPFGGKKKRALFWLRWLYTALTHPSQVIRFGWSSRTRIWFKLPTKYATKETASDAFFIATLPLAIATQEDLVFEGAVSKEILAKTQKIHEYYHEIVRKKIHVEVLATTKNQLKKRHVGQFFTLGADSFYTLCCHQEKKDPTPRYILYVDGYDVPFFHKQFLNTVHKKITNVAKQTHSVPLFIQTNLRQVSDAVIGWGRYHVSALVAASTFLDFKKMYISGESFESSDWGLRLGVDMLYSTSHLQVKFIAHGVGRLQKLKAVLNTPYSKLLLNNLRVCWENVNASKILYNCSVCQKCLKTQLTFFALGVQKLPTFLPIEPRQLEKIRLVEHVLPEWQHIYKMLKKRSDIDPDVILAMDKVLKKPVRV